MKSRMVLQTLLNAPNVTKYKKLWATCVFLMLFLAVHVVAGGGGTRHIGPVPLRTDGEVAAAQWEDGDGQNGISLASLGNHRVRVSCPATAGAAVATIEWRRPDLVPSSHGVLVTASSTSRDAIKNATILNVSRASGTIVFDTRNHTDANGFFFVYWLPFTRNHLGQWGAVAVSYDGPKQTADPVWVASHIANEVWRKLPHCTVVAYEARDTFNRFSSMEVVATSAEMASAAAAAHPAPFLLFPEDRQHTVRDFHRIPSRYLPRAAAAAAGSCQDTALHNRARPNDARALRPRVRAKAMPYSEPAPHGCDGSLLTFSGSARPGEFFVFQLVVWALQPLSDVKVHFEPLVQTTTDGVLEGVASPQRHPRLEIDPTRINCVNTGGTSYLGQSFTRTVDVTKGDVQPLYIGVDIPANLTSATPLVGTFTVVEESGYSVPVQVHLTLAGQSLLDHGDSNPQQLSRVRWLDSTVGIDYEPPLGFQPIELDVTTATVRANGKTVVINHNTGFPEQVSVEREVRRSLPASAPTMPLKVLRAPVEFAVLRKGFSSPVKWCSNATDFRWTLRSSAVVGWTFRLISCDEGQHEYHNQGQAASGKINDGTSFAQPQTYPPLELEVNGTLEFDGYMDYSADLVCSVSSAGACEFETVDLRLYLSQSASRYASGLGKPGSSFPSSGPRLWEWADFANATAHGVAPGAGWMAWIGDVTHGLRLKLKGEDSLWEQPAGYTSDAPISWAGQRGGGNLSLLAIGDHSVLSASSGFNSIESGATLRFQFDLVTTPVKRRDARHFHWRYLMGCGGCDGPNSTCPPPTKTKDYNVTDIGVNAVILHQGCSNNPYINWPWSSSPDDTFPAELRAFVADRHHKGVRTLMYYTTRELSNRAAELDVLRSLGQEVIVDGDTSKSGGIPTISGGAGGVSWLQEHLRTNYTPGWTTLVRDNKTDAAIGDVGVSRWGNYYVEGMRNLACETDVDGKPQIATGPALAYEPCCRRNIVHYQGANFDGLNYPRHTMARLRKVTESCRGNATLFNMHGGNSLLKDQVSTVVAYAAHYTFIDSLMDGEQFNYTEGPEYYLLELSAIPFGMMNDLYGWTGGIGEPNIHYGALYGMNARLPNGPGLQVIESVWHLWDALGISEYDMYGYWDEFCPVKVNGGDGAVLATAFVRHGQTTFIPIANFAKHPGLPSQNVTLTIEWDVLGLDARNTSLCAPQLLGIQTKLPQEHPFGLYADGDTLSIPSGGGLWLVLTTRAHPIVDVFEIGQPLGCCTGQAPPQ